MTIPSCFARSVVNLRNTKDLISHVASGVQSIKSPHATAYGVTTKKCESLVCHGALDYLKTPVVGDVLRGMTTPTMYQFAG